MADTSQKDAWDKLQVIAIVVASLFVPLAVAFVGHSYSNAMKESENRLKYVELAISILRTAPTSENAALRDWAVEVLQKQSIVPLSPEAQAQLKQHRVDLGWFLAGPKHEASAGYMDWVIEDKRTPRSHQKPHAP